MSRVDDDRQAARAAERQNEARRTEELQRSKKKQEATTFKKLVGDQQAQGQTAQQRATQQQGAQKANDLGKSAIASLLEAAEHHAADGSKHAKEAHHSFGARLGKTVSNDQTRQGVKREGEQQQVAGESGRQLEQQGSSLASLDKGATARVLDDRKADAKHTREALAERHEASESQGTSSAGGAGALGEKGDLKADADKGGGGQGGQQKDKENAPSAQPGFRFNPALMAPVPVAKPKEASGSERLRKVANELAQKIVERVRVGTNAAGKVEFQIDLRSDVLKGLSVKVSSHQGRIKAVFQGGDRDVMKLIEEQREALTIALKARGLTLEDFVVEARK